MRKNQYLLCDEKTEIFWIIKPASPPGKISFLTIARLSGEGGEGGEVGGNLIVKLEMLKYQTPEKVTRNEVYLETGCLTDCVLSTIIQEYDKLVCKLKTNMTPTDLSSLRL